MRKQSGLALLCLFMLAGCTVKTAKATATDDIEAEGSLSFIKNEYLLDSSFKRELVSLEDKTGTDIIYASPEGKGNGTKDNPYSLSDAIDSLSSGDTLYLLGGTYSLSDTLYITESGSEKEYITIAGNPGDEAILTSSMEGEEQILMSLEADYLDIYNLTFRGVSSKNACGIAAYGGGQNHLMIHDCTFSDIKTTRNDDPEYGANAILLMGESKNSINNVYIGRNTVRNNVLGYSEAISVAGNCEGIYVMDNVLENNTNIGIDFYGNAGYCSVSSLDQPRYSVVAGNEVSGCKSFYASSAGIYADGARNLLITENKVTDSQYGIEVGSEEKNARVPVRYIYVTGNTVENNTECGIRTGGYDPEESGVCHAVFIEENLIRNNQTELIFGMCDGVKVSKNTIAGSMLIDTEDFTEAHVKNMTFTENEFESDMPLPVYYLGNAYSIPDFKEAVK